MPPGATPTATPRPTREDALALGRELFLRKERVDLRRIAQELGVGRTTLYRWVGDREQLLGEVLGELNEGAWQTARARAEGEGLPGLRDAVDRFAALTTSFAPAVHFARTEPAMAIRVLMDPDGRVRRDMVARVTEELAAHTETGVSALRDRRRPRRAVHRDRLDADHDRPRARPRAPAPAAQRPRPACQRGRMNPRPALAALSALALAAALPACGSSSASSADSGSSSTSSTQASSGSSTTKKAASSTKPAAAPYSPPKGAKPDPLRGRQYGLDEIDLPAAWKKSAAQGVTIAIVDSGVDLSHPDLKSRLVAGHDFVGNDSTPKDENGHGTHVAGIAAAATENGVGVSGGAPDAKIMPVRVLDSKGSGSQANIGKGIQWAADHGAKVINLSLGESGLAGELLRGGELNADIEHAVQRGRRRRRRGRQRRHGEQALPHDHAGPDRRRRRLQRPAREVLQLRRHRRRHRARRADRLDAARVLDRAVRRSTARATATSTGRRWPRPYVSAVAALLVAQGRTPQQVIDAIQATAKNPNHVQKLGLGIVDAAAAVASAKDVKPKSSTSEPSSGTETTPKQQPKRERGGGRKRG